MAPPNLGKERPLPGIGTTLKRIGPKPEILDQFGIRRNLGNFRRSYRRPDKGGDFLAAQPRKHPRQQGSPQSRMDEPGALEKLRIASHEVHGHDGGARLAGNGGNGGRPRRIAHNPRLQIDAGNFSGRKDAQDMSLFKPADGIHERALVRRRRRLGSERIHENEALAHLRDESQEIIGHHLVIRADRTQNLDENNALDAAERMIGDNDDRSLLGNLGQIFRGNHGLNPHAIQNGVVDIVILPALHPGAAFGENPVERRESEHALHQLAHQRITKSAGRLFRINDENLLNRLFLHGQQLPLR